jgi:hypothetical protein
MNRKENIIIYGGVALVVIAVELSGVSYRAFRRSLLKWEIALGVAIIITWFFTRKKPN